MAKPSNSSQTESPLLFLLILAICVAAWLAWGYLVVPWLAAGHFPLKDDALGAAGQFGDLFGGINALFTALAFAAVAWSGWMQRKELALQREELALQRSEVAETRAVFKRQNFEGTFFAQLGLLRDVREGASFNLARGLDAIKKMSSAG